MLSRDCLYPPIVREAGQLFYEENGVRTRTGDCQCGAFWSAEWLVPGYSNEQQAEQTVEDIFELLRLLARNWHLVAERGIGARAAIEAQWSWTALAAEWIDTMVDG